MVALDVVILSTYTLVEGIRGNLSVDLAIIEENLEDVKEVREGKKYF